MGDIKYILTNKYLFDEIMCSIFEEYIETNELKLLPINNNIYFLQISGKNKSIWHYYNNRIKNLDLKPEKYSNIEIYESINGQYFFYNGNIHLENGKVYINIDDDKFIFSFMETLKHLNKNNSAEQILKINRTGPLYRNAMQAQRELIKQLYVEKKFEHLQNKIEWLEKRLSLLEN